MVNFDVEKVLETEMSRKQFLKNVGVGLVALTGVTAALRAFSAVSTQTQSGEQYPQPRGAAGYGSSPYGGATSRPNLTSH